VSRAGSSAGIGLEALRTGRRSVPSAAWRNLNSMPSIQTKDNSILNLTVHENTAYIGTGSGVLYAVNLEPTE
jgi:hypothetical protein